MNQVILQFEREDFSAELFGNTDDVGQTADTLQKLQHVMDKKLTR